MQSEVGYEHTPKWISTCIVCVELFSRVNKIDGTKGKQIWVIQYILAICIRGDCPKQYELTQGMHRARTLQPCHA